MKKKANLKRNNEAGASLVEYGLLVALILGVAIVSVQDLGWITQDKLMQASTFGGGTEATDSAIGACPDTDCGTSSFMGFHGGSPSNPN